jgi:hypothetical protein
MHPQDVAKTGMNEPAIARLVELLSRQRQALLRRDAAAVGDLESGTRQIEEALTTLGALLRQRPERLPQASADALATLQNELQAGQAIVSRLAAGNRRALDALFGEASLYSR